MKITPRQRKAMKKLSAKMKADPNVVSVTVGFKYVQGRRTDEAALVVGVKKKVSISAAAVAVPEREEGVRTDVIEYGTFEAYSRGPRVEATAQGKTTRLRPIPGGYSIGHPAITAGTLGVWVRSPTRPGPIALTNNHVGADTNKATLGDILLQPGRYDGGIHTRDEALVLLEYAHIHMGSTPPDPDPPPPPPPDDGKKRISKAAWKVWLAPANLISRGVGCRNRAVVVNLAKAREGVAAANKGIRILPRAIEQPWPNLIDAAIAGPLEDALEPIAPDPPFIEEIGEIAGIRDLELGDNVAKIGRTTGFKGGMVEAIGDARVSYREDGTGEFEDQLIIRGHAGDFSAGGDSGSAIIDENNYLGGLLFAGGGGVTIANRISHVVAILGITV